jgi:hypothetical protein
MPPGNPEGTEPHDELTCADPWHFGCQFTQRKAREKADLVRVITDRLWPKVRIAALEDSDLH